MQQRRRRRVSAHERRHHGQQALAVALQGVAEPLRGRERELRREAAVAKERAPIVAPRVRLRGPADPVVARPAVALAARTARRGGAMQSRERISERRAMPDDTHGEPFEREIFARADRAGRGDARHADRARRRQRPQAVRLARQHAGAASGRRLDEQAPAPDRERPRVAPAGRTDAIPLRDPARPDGALDRAAQRRLVRWRVHSRAGRSRAAQWRSASMPCAMPPSVSGNIRGPSASRIICVVRVYSHVRGGSGFHQTTLR